MSCSILEPKSASTCDYQPEDDGSKEFKVSVPHELRGKTMPRDKAIISSLEIVWHACRPIMVQPKFQQPIACLLAKG